MAKILGLDLGTNSIGWALIDDSKKEIIKTNVRIFPEGVNDINQSKEKSKNADRRIARGIRRNNFRFKKRRERLKKVLKELGMMPDEKYYTFMKKKKDEKNYLTIELYKLRKDALEKPLRLEDLGRIFLQLNNHRGFKSNKKEEANKEFKPNIKDAGKINTLVQKQSTLFTLNKRKEKLLKEIEELKISQRKDAAKRINTREKKIKGIKNKIKEIEEVKTLQEKIDEAKNNGLIKYGTLGEYFYHRIELNKNSHNPNHPFVEQNGTGRLRNNDEGKGEYTTREIFEFEFDTIWEIQKGLNKNNPTVLSAFSDENKRKIKDECIFYQRDLRSQKHLVDRCKYEFTEYFVYCFDEKKLQQQVDTITFSNSKPPETFLTATQKKKLLEFLSKQNKINVADLKNLVGIKDDFQKVNKTFKNHTLIHHLPQERIWERDYLPCCHISSLEFQEFRIWDKVNNLRYVDDEESEYSLTLEQRKILVEKLQSVTSLTIETGNKASDEEKEEAAEIKEALGLTNKHKFKEQKLKGNVTVEKLKEALGEDYWNSLSPITTELEIEDIDKTTGEIVKLKSPFQYSDKQRQFYNNIVFAMNFTKSIDWLLGKGKAKKWKESLSKLKEEATKTDHELTDSQIEAYSRISFEPDYCNYSLKAIKKLLPWMKQGLNSSQAAEKVGYESASDERRNDNFLQDKLPDLKNNSLRNPIVQKGITETIKLVNEIIEKELGGIKPDKIHLEMARELKKPKKARLEMKKKNDEKEKERNHWKEFLKQTLGVYPSGSTLSKFELFLELEHQKENFEEKKNQISVEEFITFCKEVMGESISISRKKFIELKMELNKKNDNKNTDEKGYETISASEGELEEKKKSDKNHLKLLKYRLYLECNRILPYTGQPIGLKRLLSDNSDIEIEHIIPYSRCMDDSFLNKTLSDRTFNTLKGKQTPIEFFASNLVEKKKFFIRVNKIANDEKKKRFLLEGDKALEDFRNSQLVNTAYIGSEVKKHLLNTFKRDDIILTNGQITAMLRSFLGFTKVLNTPMKFEGEYNKGLYWAYVNQEGKIERLIERNKEDDKKPEPENHSRRVIKGFVYEGQDGKRFQPQKQRNDHRHHSIDAVTIALSSNKIANIIQKNTEGYYVKNGKPIQKYEDGAIWVKKFDENGELANETRKKIIDEINAELNFPNLWIKTKNAVEHIPVSYSNKNRILSAAKRKIHKNNLTFYSGGDIARGALHEESLYGNIQYPYNDKSDWNEKENGIYVIRKALKYNKKGYFGKIEQLEKIIDPKIREIVIEEVNSVGMKKALDTGVFLPNKNGNPTPIKKVRIASDTQELTWIRKHKQGTKENKKKVWVETGDNYCIALYGNEVVEKKEKREFRSISFLEAVRKTKRGEQLFPEQLNGKKLLTSLSKKDMVLVYKEHPDEITHLIGKKNDDYTKEDKELLFKRLFVVRKSDKNGIIVLSRHNLSGARQEDDITVKDLDSTEGKVIRCNQSTFKGIKISIDRLGNIKPAL